jgi:phosphoserine phosphatase RsbU/P
MKLDSRGTRVLAVDDDTSTRMMFHGIISGAGWEPVLAGSGAEAFDLLMAPDAPRVALVDWLMPEMSGIDLCQRLRTEMPASRLYIIFVTVKSAFDDIAHGLDIGADDYMVKPIAPAELRSRVRVGFRTLELQDGLADRVRELEASRAQVRQLRDLLPICSYCRRIRDDDDYWQDLEEYLSRHTAVKFSHGFCPSCYKRHVLPELELKGE